MKKSNKFLKDTSIDTGASAAGALVGTMIAGPLGTVVGAVTAPVLSDVLKRFLSQNEKTRIEKAADLANKLIQERLNKGQTPTKNGSNPKIKELFEGMLLSAKDSYEEKKIPLLANLFATAPFTNTPLTNLVQSLKTAESLSYRKLCILSVIGKYQWEGGIPLNKQSFKDAFSGKVVDEMISGIYFDILSLMSEGLVIQMENDNDHVATIGVVARIIPAQLRLYYTGSLLYNGMQLDTIEEKDFAEVFELLK